MRLKYFSFLLALVSLSVMLNSFVVRKTFSPDVNTLDGTFQIIYKTKIHEQFSSELFDFVASNRDDDSLVIAEYSRYTRIKIWPDNYINSPQFVPVNPVIVYFDGENAAPVEEGKVIYR